MPLKTQSETPGETTLALRDDERGNHVVTAEARLKLRTFVARRVSQKLEGPGTDFTRSGTLCVQGD
jgi:hypothetical protein